MAYYLYDSMELSNEKNITFQLNISKIMPARQKHRYTCCEYLY